MFHGVIGNTLHFGCRIPSSNLDGTTKYNKNMKYDWSKEKLEQVIPESDSLSDVLNKL